MYKCHICTGSSNLYEPCLRIVVLQANKTIKKVLNACKLCFGVLETQLPKQDARTLLTNERKLNDTTENKDKSKNFPA